MAMKIYVAWKDYDCAYVLDFDSVAAASAAVADIVGKEEAKINGTRLLAVIEGKKLEVKVTQRVQAITLEG